MSKGQRSVRFDEDVNALLQEEMNRRKVSLVQLVNEKVRIASGLPLPLPSPSPRGGVANAPKKGAHEKDTPLPGGARGGRSTPPRKPSKKVPEKVEKKVEPSTVERDYVAENLARSRRVPTPWKNRERVVDEPPGTSWKNVETVPVPEGYVYRCPGCDGAFDVRECPAVYDEKTGQFWCEGCAEREL